MTPAITIRKLLLAGILGFAMLLDTTACTGAEAPIEEWSSEPAVGGVTGEVPDDLLEAIFADLEKRTGAQRSAFKVLQTEARQWNDGGLGCPEPGQVYTQAIVDGYQVVIEHQGKSFDYHASERGYFKLCAGYLPSR